MSKFQQPPLYGPEAIQLQWINCIFQSHSLICGCDHTLKHLEEILNKRGTQLCLPGPTDSGTGEDPKDGDAVDNLIDGELEDLFKEDFTEDDG